MYFIHFTFYRFLNSIVYRFFKFVIYAFQPFGCKVNSINKTIYLSIYISETKRRVELATNISQVFDKCFAFELKYKKTDLLSVT